MHSRLRRLRAPLVPPSEERGEITDIACGHNVLVLIGEDMDPEGDETVMFEVFDLTRKIRGRGTLGVSNYTLSGRVFVLEGPQIWYSGGDPDDNYAPTISVWHAQQAGFEAEVGINNYPLRRPLAPNFFGVSYFDRVPVAQAYYEDGSLIQFSPGSKQCEIRAWSEDAPGRAVVVPDPGARRDRDDYLLIQLGTSSVGSRWLHSLCQEGRFPSVDRTPLLEGRALDPELLDWSTSCAYVVELAYLRGNRASLIRVPIRGRAGLNDSLAEVQVGRTVNDLQLSPSGGLIAAACDDGLYVVQTGSMNVIGKLDDRTQAVRWKDDSSLVLLSEDTVYDAYVE